MLPMKYHRCYRCGERMPEPAMKLHKRGWACWSRSLCLWRRKREFERRQLKLPHMEAK